MIIGLEARPSAKSMATKTYLPTPGLRTYQPYANSARKRKNVHSRLFRSETHATHSTFSGCNANKAATKKLRQGNRSRHAAGKTSRTTLTACSIRLRRVVARRDAGQRIGRPPCAKSR